MIKLDRRVLCCLSYEQYEIRALSREKLGKVKLSESKKKKKKLKRLRTASKKNLDGSGKTVSLPFLNLEIFFMCLEKLETYLNLKFPIWRDIPCEEIQKCQRDQRDKSKL